VLVETAVQNSAELSAWAPLIQTVVGGLIGVLGAIAGGTFSHWYAQQKERQALAAALAAEVQGLSDIVETNQTATSSSEAWCSRSATTRSWCFTLP